MVLVIALGFVVNSLWSNHSQVLSYATSIGATSLLQETNTQRTQQGIGALALNNSLSKAAQDKANDMAARNYWAHITPDGVQPWEFMSAAGYEYTEAGENLAYGFATSSDTVIGWMNSPAHRDNLLKGSYKEVGFGIANAENFQGNGEQTIVVAMYGTPLKSVVAAAQNPVPTPAQAPSLAPDTPVSSPSPTLPEPIQPTPPADDTPAPAANSPSTAQPAIDATEEARNLTATPVTRFEVLTAGNAQWGLMVIAVLASVAAITFVYRHGKMWRRYLVKGERFLIKHPLYDIALVAAVVVSVVLSRTSGFVH